MRAIENCVWLHIIECLKLAVLNASIKCLTNRANAEFTAWKTEAHSYSSSLLYEIVKILMNEHVSININCALNEYYTRSEC